MSKKEKAFHKASKDALRNKIANIGKSDFISYLNKEIKVYKMKDGDNFLRILPPAEGGDFSQDIYVHSFVGPNDGSYLCLEKNYDEKCPICVRYKKAKGDGDDELAKQLAPKKRVLYLVLDVSEKPQSTDALVFDSPSQLSDEILRQCMDRKTKAVNDISDASEGREVIFTKVGKGIKTKYQGVTLGDVYPLDDDIADQILPFEDLLQEPTTKALKEVAKSYDVEEDEEDEEE